MTSHQASLAIIGGGNMGSALLAGLLSGGPLGAHDIVVVEPNEVRRTELEATYPGVAMATEVPAVDDVLLAVKPQHIVDAIRSAANAGASRALSVAAGVTTATMAEAAGDRMRIVRAMPNTPALVGQGITAVCAGPRAGRDDVDWAAELLAPTGLVVVVEEGMMDAVTGLTGSGPAYLFAVAESLISAGRNVGLPEDLLEPMVTQLMVGSAALLAERGDPAALRVAVTSPGGTTEAGLAVLDAHGLRAAIEAAVEAATSRSRELGAANS